jgi:hypothetical protein
MLYVALPVDFETTIQSSQSGKTAATGHYLSSVPIRSNEFSECLSPQGTHNVIIPPVSMQSFGSMARFIVREQLVVVDDHRVGHTRVNEAIAPFQ